MKQDAAGDGSGWKGEGSDILQTYSPLEIYCKSRRARDLNPPLRVNKPNGLWKFATFARCLCCCLRFFLTKKARGTTPSPSRSLGRFRFYLSKVFHSSVIVWVASTIVAKSEYLFGVRLLSICDILGQAYNNSTYRVYTPSLCHKLNLRGLKSNVVVRNDLSPTTSDTIKKLIVDSQASNHLRYSILRAYVRRYVNLLSYREASNDGRFLLNLLPKKLGNFFPEPFNLHKEWHLRGLVNPITLVQWNAAISISRNIFRVNLSRRLLCIS